MRTRIYDNMYNGLPLNITAKGHDGYYEEVLATIYKVMTYMYDNCDNVFMAQFTLKYPADISTQENESNLPISRCCWNITRALRAEGIYSMFVWAREQLSSENPHYHLMLLVDGKRVQDIKGLSPMVDKYWQRCLNVQSRPGLTFSSQYNVPPSGGFMITKDGPANDNVVFKRCYQWGTYLAKSCSKEGRPPHINGYGSSQIPAYPVNRLIS